MTSPAPRLPHSSKTWFFLALVAFAMVSGSVVFAPHHDSNRVQAFALSRLGLATKVSAGQHLRRTPERSLSLTASTTKDAPRNSTSAQAPAALIAAENLSDRPVVIDLRTRSPQEQWFNDTTNEAAWKDLVPHFLAIPVAPVGVPANQVRPRSHPTCRSYLSTHLTWGWLCVGISTKCTYLRISLHSLPGRRN
jgi:hypothetical protein